MTDDLIAAMQKELREADRRIAELKAALTFYSCQCDLTDNKNQRCGGAHDEQFCGYVSRMAKDRRIAHLEEMFNGWRDEAIKAAARIAELEAALKEVEELLSDAYENTGRGDYGLGCIAARAAYLGEKEPAPPNPS